jgi:DNA-directed RNA polymerase specialized sigma subunit
MTRAEETAVTAQMYYDRYIETKRRDDFDALSKVCIAGVEPLLKKNRGRLDGLNPTEEKDRMVSVAYDALIASIDSYDPSKRTAFFSHYCSKVNGYLMKEGRTLIAPAFEIPSTMAELAAYLKRNLAKLSTNEDRNRFFVTYRERLIKNSKPAPSMESLELAYSLATRKYDAVSTSAVTGENDTLTVEDGIAAEEEDEDDAVVSARAILGAVYDIVVEKGITNPHTISRHLRLRLNIPVAVPQINELLAKTDYLSIRAVKAEVDYARS